MTRFYCKNDYFQVLYIVQSFFNFAISGDSEKVTAVTRAGQKQTCSQIISICAADSEQWRLG